MLIRVLGAAAGGGSPQWNCRCAVCEAARDGRAQPRTQSSVAIRSVDGRWFVCNASPDLRQQLGLLPRAPTAELRENPVAGVLLTDGEIDHTAGLLLMREAGAPLRVWSGRDVRDALTGAYPVLTMLERYCGVDWAPLEAGVPVQLDGDLAVEAFPTGGDAPLYLGDADTPAGAFGLTFTDGRTGGIFTYAPGLAKLDETIVARLRASDAVAVDGTFWAEDELVAAGLSRRGAHAMGHLPLAPPSGTLPLLAALPGRTLLVHVNNTNPILLDDSPERAAVDACGVEVALDGLEIEL